jgi:RNA polymerase sigma-70 factor (ECF subfamily)
MVFNLYALEGYKHKEIATLLKIDVNTSKSQYSRARSLIRKKLDSLKKIAEKVDEQD